MPHGRVIAVTEEVDGDYLDVAATATDTEIQLEDASPFDEDGGKALIVDSDGDIQERIVYTSADFDTDILTLSGGLMNSYDSGVLVQVRPEHKTRYAAIQPDDDEAPSVRARIPFYIKSQLPLGQRSPDIGDDDIETRPPEEVVFEMVRGEWVVKDIIGTFPVSDEKFMTVSKTFRIPRSRVEVGHYDETWTADKRYRIMGVRGRAGRHDADTHPNDGVPQGADILIQIWVTDAADETSRAVLAADDRLRIDSGTHKDAQWIREEDVDWNVKFIEEDESVNVRLAQVGSSTPGGPLEVTLVLVPEEVVAEMVGERGGDIDATAGISSSGVINP